MRFDGFGALARRGVLAALLCTFALPALAQSETSENPKRIGIIGAGHLGGTLGRLWLKAGYEVLFSSRHPEELKPLIEELGPKARAGTPADAMAFGRAVLIAVPYKAYPEIGRENAAALKGKVVIDAGNAVRARDGALSDEVERDGIGAVSARYLAGARIVRGFNAANYKTFLKHAGRPAPRMAVPIAGDDPQALDIARTLVTDAGFDPVVVGGLEAARKFARTLPGSDIDGTAADVKAQLGVAP